MSDQRTYSAQTSIFSKRLRKIWLPNCSETQLYGKSFLLFLMMYGKLVHKFTNVKTAKINKLLIAFVNWVTLANIYIQQPFTPNLFSQLFPQLDYVVQFFMLFPAMYSKLRHKLVNVKIARINKCRLDNLQWMPRGQPQPWPFLHKGEVAEKSLVHH
jgi:hypothetical protein